MKIYKIACIGTSILFIFLFVQLFFTPIAFVGDLGLESTLTTSILCRRAAMFMFGLAVLLWGARKLEYSSTRQTISLSTAFTMTGLALLSSFEMTRGTVNNSIWTAIIIESISAVLFWVVFFKDLRTKTN